MSMPTPQEEAQAALRRTPTDALLTTAYGLSRRMQIDKGTDHEDDLRAQRDMITAEVLRRTGLHSV